MLELFELELLGGTVEQKYRHMRPEVDEMPWGTLNLCNYSDSLILAARKAWTGAAFQEFRTAAACAATLRALIEARAPLDLIALASRFPTDEMVHVELCSRVASEFGGAIEWAYDANNLIENISDNKDPLVRAAHLVVGYFCVGESLSIPLLHNTSLMAEQPLLKDVLRRIVLDEADHGTFGWAFLDWALPLLPKTEKSALALTADRFISSIYELWSTLRKNSPSSNEQAHELGWLGTKEYLSLAEKSLEKQVIKPFLTREIPISVTSEEHKTTQSVSPILAQVVF